jgi:small-conductance mechanosensitive channel
MIVITRFFLTLALLFWSIGAAAQSSSTLDYGAWETVASRAETAVENATASSAVLEELRAEIAEWRTRFFAAETAEDGRIDTLRTQIEALGPPPAEGESEPDEITARRATLNAQLTRLEAPQITASEAFTRADGLVDQLDNIIRARQTDVLLRLDPSPLNPATWPASIATIVSSWTGITGEVKRAWNSDAQYSEFRQNLPASLGFLAIAIALLARGRYWTERLTNAAQERMGGSASAGFVVSLLQLIVPVAGIFALVAAVNATGLLGARGQSVLGTLPYLGLSIFGARWLAVRLFPRRAGRVGPLDVSDDLRPRARWYTSALGVLVGLSVVITALVDLEGQSGAAISVLTFPLMIGFGIVLYRLGRLLRQIAASPTEDSDADTGFKRRLISLLGRGVIAVSILGPIASAVGYQELASSVVIPTAMSLGLIGFLMLLTDPIRDAYALVTRTSRADAEEALIPVLVSFAVFLASAPLFALLWGARQAELGEIWSRFTEGVRLGDARITPGVFLTVIVLFAIGYALTRLIQGALRTTVLPKTKIDPGGRNAIVSGVGYVGIFLAALISITAAGIDLSSLAIVAGALSVGIGFGLQNIVSNFVSGIILLIERPISEGDWIEVGGHMGYVRDISVRSTRIETFDRTDVIVPNADFVSGAVVNWTRGDLIGRVIVPVGVAYGSDTREVEKILREIAEDHPMVSLNPPPSVVFQGFGADSMDFEIRAILRDVNFSLGVKSDMNHEIAKRFADGGIEIPFAQRDIWLRNPETLRKGPPPPPEPAVEEPAPPPPAQVQDNDGDDA